MRRASWISGLLSGGFALLLPSVSVAQLPQPRTLSNSTALGQSPGYGSLGGGGYPQSGGVGGAMPDSQGRLIDHTYNPQNSGLGQYPGLGGSGPGYGGYGYGQGAATGSGGGIPDASGRLIDHTYRPQGGGLDYGAWGGQGSGGGGLLDNYSGPPLTSGQTLGLNSYNTGSSATQGSTGTGIYGGGRTNAYFASQGFYNYTNRYSGSSTNQNYGGQSLTPFSRRSTSPYLNLINSRGAAAVRYYGLVRPQFASESQFKAIADRVNQNQEALKIDNSLRVMEGQMQAALREQQSRIDTLQASEFTTRPGSERFPSLAGGLGAAAGASDQQDQYYNQQLVELQAQIQGNALGGSYSEAPVPRIRVPSIGGGGAPPPNFGNMSHYYGQTQNVPNWRYSR